MVLKDHIRKGSLLLPPLLADDKLFSSTQWHMERLPELFLIAMSNKVLGVRRTLTLIEQMCTEVQPLLQTIRRNSNVVRPYIVSQHAALTPEERESIGSACGESDWFTTFARLVQTYPLIWAESSIAYLLGQLQPCPTSFHKQTNTIREIIEECYDRHSLPSLIVQGVVISTEFDTGGLKLAAHLDPPKLNELMNYPKTEASQRAAGFVVASCAPLVTQSANVAAEWPRRFWNQCFKMSECEYNYGR